MLHSSTVCATVVLCFSAVLCTSSANSQTLTLPYRPVTAEYSTALDRIIFIAANPNQLHIFDPSTNIDTAINLPKPPLSLSVSLDGLHAAVGHDALISYVNLQMAYLEKTLPATTTVNSLVLGNDYVYILTYSGGTEWIRISTGATGSNGVYNGTTGRLHPGGTAIYTTEDGLSPEHLQDMNVSTGPVTNVGQGPYHGDYPVCGGVWFSPDGRRTYTGCAAVYQAAPQDTNLGLLCCGSGSLDTKADDLYWTTLAGTAQIRSLSESASLGRVAAIPYSQQYASIPMKDNQVFLYESAYLEPAGAFQLPDFAVNGTAYQAHGQQVFYNQASTALYVVMQADGSSGLLNNFAVQVFPLSNPPACAATFTLANETLPASGTIAMVGITAPASCIYQASSNSNWIQLISGSYGSGNGTLTYVVRPNSGADRTGTITLGGQTFTVTQPAASTSPNSLTRLGYSVAGADYSAALDRVVLIVSSPKELHIYDPVSGSDQIVPLPKTPFCVSVSPDGFSAAVGYDGWVSIVNLSTASVTSTIQVFTDVHTILLGGHGFVYAYPQRTWASVFSVRIATGAIDYATAIYNGRYPRLYVDGNSFYTESSKWDISQGSAKVINQNLSGGCAPFWLTEDGNRMITGCGKAYTTSPVPTLDMQYNGMFSNAANIQWATESMKLHSTAVIPSVGYSGTGNADTYLQIYGDTYISYSGEILLPTFLVGSTSYAGRGRYVFHNTAADKLIVLEQADSTAKLAADYGVTVYSLTTPAVGCSFSLGASSATFDKNGGLNTASVTTGDGCIWEAASHASWITVNSGAAGFGAGAVSYTVAPNFGSARNGTITIAGQTFMITQAGSSSAGSRSNIFLQFPDGSMGVWYAGGSGRQFTVTGFAFMAGPSSGISLVDAVDLNGDGIPDLILRFSDGSIGVWYMGGPQGTNITAFAFISGPLANWMPAGLADLNGDGHPDLVIQHTDGTMGVWYLGGSQGNQIQSFAPISGPIAWRLVGMADVNGDGQPDAIIRNTDGTIGVWYLGGAQGNQIQSFGVIAGPSTWSAVGTTDIDGDGHPDLLIRNTDGTLGIWYLGAQGNLNGFTPITPPGNTNWKELGPH